MRTIAEQIDFIRANKKIGLMTHVVIGYPNLKDTVTLVKLMEQAGADFVELQIPFSDPLADGPTIMKANDKALENGVTLQDCFKIMKRLSSEVRIPLLFMGYFNTVFHYGVEKFCREAKLAGAQGLIIPDIPPDEENHEQFMKYCEANGLHHIKVLSPTSTDERIALNAKYQNGFVYCTARSGTTGVKNELDPEIAEYLRRVKKQIKAPLAVGFGISKPEHIQALVGHADIAVVGSALIEVIQKERIYAVTKFMLKLKK